MIANIFLGVLLIILGIISRIKTKRFTVLNIILLVLGIVITVAGTIFISMFDIS
ncbi:MAG: hypothetical protein JWO47_1019 [Candidatus Saccharibacteria bacterium]|nr:hypothetical protein [Candidatus Saccharibacteria bacterium]